MRATFNILAICGAAAFCGVMLCIELTLGGYWRALAPEAFVQWFVVYNPLISKSIVSTFLPMFFGLVGSVWLSRHTPGLKYWSISGACIVLLAVLTVAYFMPMNTAFASNSIEITAVSAKVDQWLTVHLARILLAVVAAVLGCIGAHRQCANSPHKARMHTSLEGPKFT